MCYRPLASLFARCHLLGPTYICVHLAASFDDSVLPLAFLSAKTRPESAEHAPRAAAAEPALASDPFSQSPAAEAIRFRTPTLQAIVFAAMRPLLSVAPRLRLADACSRAVPARAAAAARARDIRADAASASDCATPHAIDAQATTMSGKTRPDTGCVLVSEPRVDRVGKAQVLNAELVTSDGYVATASFETPWFLQLGNYYDVEVRSKEGGDGAFLVSKTPPQGTSSSASVLRQHLRDQAAAAPLVQGVRVYGMTRPAVDGGRLLEYSFTALKGAGVQRRAFVKAVSAGLKASSSRRQRRRRDGKKTTARKPRGPSSTRCECRPRRRTSRRTRRATTGRTSRRCPIYHRRRRAAGRRIVTRLSWHSARRHRRRRHFPFSTVG